MELPYEARFFLAPIPAETISGPLQANEQRLAAKDAEWWRRQITKETLVENHLTPYENSTREQRIHDLAEALSQGRHGAVAAYAASLVYEKIAKQEAERGLERQEAAKAAIPKRDLYKEYQAERSAAAGARKAAEKDVYDRFATYGNQLRSFQAVQREQQKLEVQHRVLKRYDREVQRAEHGRDRIEAYQLKAQQLAAARAAHPLPTWDKFLVRESERGDQEATRLLRQRQVKQHEHGHER